MKKIKLIFAVAGITVAIFGNYKANSKENLGSPKGCRCEGGDGVCGYTSNGKEVLGRLTCD